MLFLVLDSAHVEDTLGYTLTPVFSVGPALLFYLPENTIQYNTEKQFSCTSCSKNKGALQSH